MNKPDKVIEPWLVAGTSLYWASVVIQLLNPTNQGILRDLYPMFSYSVLAIFAAAFGAWPGPIRTSRGRSGTLIAILILSVAKLLLKPFFSNVAVQIAYTLCQLACISALMVLWGLAMASMDRRRAGANVAASLICTSIPVIVGCAIPNVGPVSTNGMLMAASTGVALSGKVRFSSEMRTRATGYQRPAANFVASRMLYGLILGICAATCQGFAMGTPAPALMVFSLVCALACIAFLMRNREALYTAPPTLLLVSAGLIYIPFFLEGPQMGVDASAALLWLAWAGLSGVQLSDLKEVIGIRETSLVTCEKTLLSVSIALGGLIGRGLGSLDLVDMGPFAFMTSCALILASCMHVGLLVGNRRDDAVRQEAAQSRHARLERVYQDICIEYGLSERERDVLGLLAEGYTRTYIKEALGVSDGTVKSHTAHIYQKMEIHHKDELLREVERRQREA